MKEGNDFRSGAVGVVDAALAVYRAADASANGNATLAGLSTVTGDACDTLTAFAQTVIAAHEVELRAV